METSGKYDKRNFIINATEGALFLTGSSLISYTTVLPVLVYRLGGNNIAVGFLSIIIWLGLFLPQLFASKYALNQPWKKPGAIQMGLIQRIILPFIILTLSLFGNEHPQISLVLFFILIFLYQVATGLATPIWFDMFAKLTPVGLRGKLFGIRTFLTSAGSFLGAYFLTWTLSNFLFPLNFILIFSATFFLQLTSILLQYFLVEETPSNIEKVNSLTEFYDQVRKMLQQNIHLKKFLVAVGTYTIGTMSLGFFTVYGIKNFNTNDSIVGELTIIMIIGQAIGALLNGYIADQYGNKIALIIAVGGMLTASAITPLIPTLNLYKFIFLFIGINIGSEIMLRQNLVLELSPVTQRSLYIGLMNTILAPFYFAGIIGGLIVEKFGFTELFVISAIFSFTGIFLLLFFVEDPRKKNNVKNSLQ